MAGKYTEAQKKATKKYFDKLKTEGRARSHGDKIKIDKPCTYSAHIKTKKQSNY